MNYGQEETSQASLAEFEAPESQEIAEVYIKRINGRFLLFRTLRTQKIFMKETFLNGPAKFRA